MFSGCVSLKYAPHIKTTTINSNAYEHICYGCTSLERAPLIDTICGVARADNNEMPFYTYNCAFYGCSNLSAIEVKFTDWLPHRSNNPGMYTDWVYGVKSTGVFIVP